MFERYTDAARRSVVMAQEEARVHHTSPIGIDHLLLAIVRMGDDPAVQRTLSCLTCTIPALYDLVDADVPTGPARPDGHIPFAQGVKDAMIFALREAQARKDQHIGNEHLLLGIVGAGDSVAKAALEGHGATRAAMLASLGSDEAPGFQVRTTKGLGRFRKGAKGSTDGP